MNPLVMILAEITAFLLLVIVVALLLVRDIKQQHAAEEEKRRLSNYIKLLLESVGEGVFGLDLDGRCTFINPAGAALIGFRPDEVIGRNMHELIHHHRADGSVYYWGESPVFRTLRGGDDCRVRDEVLWRKGGTSFPAWYSAYPVREHGRIVGAVFSFTNISEQKKVEKMKNEFISTVSHELRTPLTSIRGALGLIAKGMAGPVPEEAKGLLDIAVHNCERLVRLVNDILDIEKIESGRMRFNIRPTSLLPLVLQVIETDRVYADQHRVKLILDHGENGQAAEIDSAMAAVDPDRLVQVVSNLLSNAIKFSPDGGTVRVAVLRRRPFVRIAVSDQGPGIPEEFRDRIFEKFAQAEPAEGRSRVGTGLGLSIAKAIVDKLGGEIAYETGPDGTTFYFDLPEWKDVPAEDGQRAKPRLLICEDDHDFAALLKMLLERLGVESDVAYSATEAMKFLTSRRYDGMTMDLALPDKDGILFLSELRENEKTRSLPVIVVSFKASPARRRLEGEDTQVVDWIDKPIDQERLMAAVWRALGLRLFGETAASGLLPDGARLGS